MIPSASTNSRKAYIAGKRFLTVDHGVIQSSQALMEQLHCIDEGLQHAERQWNSDETPG
jgi:hypothetical protein